MRKVVMFNLVSLDGFFADSNSSIDWQVVDDEFNKTAIDIIQQFDTILFGRITYQLFESFWPKAATDPETSPEDRIIANKINEMTKVVFSDSLNEVKWQNSILLNENLEEEVKKLKAQEGKDIVIYGSGTIVKQLSELGLIDEYKFMVNPIIIGDGKNMFEGLSKNLSLKLKDVRKFEGGNILSSYELIK